ncbi:HAD-IIIA family hydrolase [Rhodovulum visakhapatnamense]|uniref:D,D-heptose 1,7-bisphosphate phosphatase n=1 Tax=Rhodovulum visakhapatnamense TaxID=364297 RepID=A0A4R8GCE2_9RHOB|nr:HAD-IIIA family hydrolase [Rhodovulum visakhapatnamense]TDX33400.1 D-glycero-D-manno-heptose 1,7-bisphosphate phosphatase [Rhodovulum visakhapatnamense]
MSALTLSGPEAATARAKALLPRQAVILCGGLGTRLGPLTATCPKPLLPVGGVPFLAVLIGELARQGVERVLLLAAFEAGRVEDFTRDLPATLPRPVEIEVAREARPAGTSGALWQARDRLEDRFLLLNGDSWFDILLADVAAAQSARPGVLGALALRRVADGGRFGTVRVADGMLTAFAARGAETGPALINGGVYCLSRGIVSHLVEDGSLEAEVLPRLAAEGRLAAVERTGFFLDIGVPGDLAAAQTLVPAQRRRPAIVFDRDGVLNIDHGHVGHPDRLDWTEGAIAAVRRVNAAGWYAFVATNQAGIAKGYYTEADYLALRAHMARDLAAAGAHIDDERYCPTHPQAVHPELRQVSDRRKPGPGMLLELKHRWPVDWAQSVMIGDKPTDIEAARAAGLEAVLFQGGDLDALVERLLRDRKGKP